jgi:hypothetical protein
MMERAGDARRTEMTMAQQPWAKTPWRRDEYGHIVDADGKFIMLKDVSLAAGYGTPDEEAMIAANTQLFFGSPKLYAACRFAIAKLDDGGAHLYSPAEVEQVINAIHDAMAHAKSASK